jgi:hypothetical protein
MYINRENLFVDLPMQQTIITNRKRQHKKYRNALIAIFVALFLSGGGILVVNASSPVIFSVGESITYFGSNSYHADNSQFAIYYFTDGHNAKLALAKAAYSLGLMYLLSYVEDDVMVFSAAGMVASSVSALASTAAFAAL